MSDLISRQAVLDYIDSMPSELTADGLRMIRRIRLTEYIANTLPSAERNGKWIEGGIWYQTHYRCSECGKEVSNMSNYCPDCGARMVSDKW